ncbi:MAG: DNA-binding protein [Pseudomonadota bacterium]
MTQPKTLLNETKASEVVGFTTATLRKRRWQGLPPRFLKVGSKVYYDHDDLQEFLEGCRRTSTSDQGEHNKKSEKVIAKKGALT